MNLFAKLSLDAGGFVNPLAGARGVLASFKEGLVGIVAPMLSVQAALGAMRAGFGLMRSAIDEAAQMEDFQVAFTTLLGSTKAARDRLAELTEFAKSTPFELRDVVASSRILQAFTGDALGAGAGLRLVGDAAAAVGRPLQDVDLWMGRLFAALKDGLPLGEPIQNLTQLGLITGEVRKQLLALEKQQLSEAKVMEVLNDLFGRNAGAMERLSQTLHGRISNLRDMWSQLKRDFGEPIVDALKPFIMEVTELLERLRPVARQVGEAVAIVLQAFSGGHLKELSMLSLKLGFAEAVNFLWRQLVSVFVSLRTMLSDPGFWSGIGRAILDSLKEVTGMFTPGAPAGNDWLEDLTAWLGPFAIKRKAGSLDRDALEAGRARAGIPFDQVQFGGAGSGSIGDAIRKALEAGRAAAGDAGLFDTDQIREQWLALIEVIRAELAALKQDVVLDQEEPKAGGAFGTAKKGRRGGDDDLGDRLAKIGGFIGPAGGPALEYARRTADNTAKTEQAARQTVAALNALRSDLGLA